jgi:membrane protease YdiL (CAAX protease family)
VLPEGAALAALLGPVALFVILSYWSGQDGGSGPIAMSDARLARTFGLEVGISVTIGAWLWRRGWRPHRTATRPFAARDLLRGLGLWLAVMVGASGWALVCRWLLPSVFAVAMQTQWTGHPHLGVIIPLSLFNAVFEELLWLGLGLIAFRRFGAGVAGALSVGLRLLVHAYQGPLALISIIPLGLIFTVYYIRSGRLWPIVIAHAFQDLLALGYLAVGASGRAA